jgi:hypothetical protein
VDAELFGGLPQPDLIGELVGGLGQVAALPVSALTEFPTCRGLTIT